MQQYARPSHAQRHTNFLTGERISLGTYPTISLKEARLKHAEARKQLANGIDPSEMKKVAVATAAGQYSFQGIAMEWVALKTPGWSPSHCQKTKDILKRDLLPFLGARHIGEIKPEELLAVLKRIDQRSSATARKAYSICKQVFIHAIPTGHVLVSPAEGLHAHLSPRRSGTWLLPLPDRRPPAWCKP